MSSLSLMLSAIMRSILSLSLMSSVMHVFYWLRHDVLQFSSFKRLYVTYCCIKYAFNSFFSIESRVRRYEHIRHLQKLVFFLRSEERRVGKEGRSRWSPYH